MRFILVVLLLTVAGLVTSYVEYKLGYNLYDWLKDRVFHKGEAKQ